MRAVVTRVKSASVTIAGELHGAIGQGYLVLLGVGPDDTQETAEKLAEKIVHLRIFEDEQGRMNRDIAAVQGSILVVSQFTLYADLGGRRPGFSHAAKPDLAKPLYEYFLVCLSDLGYPPAHGEFGADMQVASVNDGPVTLLYEL
ncbi:D-aminoacyl-tRNA deacylase [Selenomonas sp.]|uniref:D-aminoacyl-tRNA deacylase n=1 Tax=Selenomonas sp. TaxID=2053611 RepID=UPI0025D9DD9B|nr:D-aminoacyl-tRNA deacylase [Selenomonas sp.]MCI6283169.1 D-aminoacyl-tRNA deacylase [Selenomonas sp.]